MILRCRSKPRSCRSGPRIHEADLRVSARSCLTWTRKPTSSRPIRPAHDLRLISTDRTTLSLTMSGQYTSDKHTVPSRRDRRWMPKFFPCTIVQSTGEAIVADHTGTAAHQCSTTASCSRLGLRNYCETWMTCGRRRHHAVHPQAVRGPWNHMDTKICNRLLSLRLLRLFDRLRRRCPSSAWLSSHQGPLSQARDRLYFVSTAPAISFKARQQIAIVCSHLFAYRWVALLTHI